jgi:hypothetical protein
MRDFARTSGRLRALPFPARLVYTVFLAFTVAALALSVWLGAEMVGADLSGLDEYYAGKTHEAAAPVPTSDTDGPALELPDDALPVSQPEPMPLRKLLEVTHFHLFSMPVYLMIIAHLFMLSSVGLRAKVTWIALGSLAVALHIAAPWISRTGTSASAFAYGGSGALLLVTFLVMALVPLVEMWRPRTTDPDDA